MGKVSKRVKRVKASLKRKQVSLEQDINEARYAKPKRQRLEIQLREDVEKEEDTGDEVYRNKKNPITYQFIMFGGVNTQDNRDFQKQHVDTKLSRKILSSAREQRREEEPPQRELMHFPKLGAPNDNSDESGSEEEEDKLEPDYHYEQIEVDEADEKAFEKFMNPNPTAKKSIWDSIKEKIAEKETEIETQFSDAGIADVKDLDPRVVQHFQKVGQILKQYRSGKLPKSFKAIPSLKNWEQLVALTDPTSWSAAAMYQATRIFASNLKDKMAERFYREVLLPRIRDDIAEYQRLNFHLYQALRQALYKPTGFMKGFLLPLLESGDCTLREAIIIGSVLERNSIPVLQSATAILMITRMEYTGASSIILRIFFDKKYSLPYRVTDAVVQHFLRFETDLRELPVLWHQSLLVFVQRYKTSITKEQRDKLLGLLHKQTHSLITPEIRRELQNAKCRDETAEEPKMDTD